MTMSGVSSCGRTFFGLDKTDHNRVVWLKDLDPFTQWGTRCNLVCPECGEDIKAVRLCADKPDLGFKCFSHLSGSTCSGSGETSLHIAAKAVLKQLIGKEIVLPAISIADGCAHTSRYRVDGRQTRQKRPSVQIEGFAFGDFYISGSSFKVKVLSALFEHECKDEAPDGLVPDAIVHVSDGTAELPVAVEFRVSHAKGIEEVRKYRDKGLAVLEILIADCGDRDGFNPGLLRKRISGFGLSTKSRYRGREWLFHPFALKLANAQLHLEIVQSDNRLKSMSKVLSIGDYSIVLVQGAPDKSESYRVWDIKSIATLLKNHVEEERRLEEASPANESLKDEKGEQHVQEAQMATEAAVKEPQNLFGRFVSFFKNLTHKNE